MPAATGTQRASSTNLLTALNINKPQNLPYLVKKYPGQVGGLFDFFNTYGIKKPVHGMTYNHWEEEHILQHIVIASQAGGDPGAGNSTVLTLAATSHTTDGVTAGAASYPQVGEHYMIKGTNVYTKVIAVNKGTPNAHTITLAPVRAADNIGVIAANDIIVPISNSYDENTGQPNAVTGQATQFTNCTQIIKSSWEESGSAMTQENWFEVGGSSGIAGFADGWAWTKKGINDAYWRHVDYVEGACLFSQKTDNTGVITDGAQTMEGYVPYIENNGGLTPTFAKGNLSAAFWDNLDDLFDRNLGAREYAAWLGLKLYQEIENWISDTMTNGAIVYGTFGGKKEIAIALGFRSFTKGNRSYHFKKYQRFNHPQNVGATGYTWPYVGLLVPMDLGNYKVEDTGSMMENVPGLCIRYKANKSGTYDRAIEQWVTGSANLATPTEEQDRLRVHWRSDCGLQVFAVNRHARIEAV